MPVDSVYRGCLHLLATNVNLHCITITVTIRMAGTRTTRQCAAFKETATSSTADGLENRNFFRGVAVLE
jgi:hypothetical protein